jgi:hypothetical protein
VRVEAEREGREVGIRLHVFAACVDTAIFPEATINWLYNGRMTKCRLCKKCSPEVSFSLKANSKRIMSTCCDSCRQKPAVTWNARNPERVRNAAIRFRDAGGARRWRLKTRYGITPEKYQSMLLAQDGVCAICGTDAPGGQSAVMHVDHDHVTGNVRGLLCTNCNRGIGYFGDDPSVLERAAKYLRK